MVLYNRKALSQKNRQRAVVIKAKQSSQDMLAGTVPKSL